MFTLTIVVSIASVAQNVGINSDGLQPHTSAALDIRSTNKGMLVPRMTSAQRKAITAPAAGLLVYDLDKTTIYMFDGSQWLPFLSATEENPYAPRPVALQNGQATAQFGYSVAISGDYAIVGAQLEDVDGHFDRGAAYIFLRSTAGWVLQAKLVAADGAAYDEFGRSVGISGNYAVVGAPLDQVGANVQQGSAYVFVRNGSTWTQQAKIVAADGLGSDYFGASVAILDSQYIAIGAPYEETTLTNQGSVYVYLRNGSNWQFQAKLNASDPGQNEEFGTSVALNGTSLLVGAPYDAAPATSVRKGGAYVFVRSGTAWTQQAKLENTGGADLDEFGMSVALSGNLAVVGSPRKTYAANMQGAVFSFLRTGTTWAALSLLTADDPKTTDRFGASVSLAGDYLVVGANLVNSNEKLDVGAIYLFKYAPQSLEPWKLVRKVGDDGASAGSWIGHSVSMSGSNIIIGSPGGMASNASATKFYVVNID